MIKEVLMIVASIATIATLIITVLEFIGRRR